MRIDIIFSDLDGTLLLGDKGLSPGTAEALARAAERGISFVPATGRFFNAIPRAVQELPFWRYAIVMNGAVVWDRRRGGPSAGGAVPELAVRVMPGWRSFPGTLDCYMEDNCGWMEARYYAALDDWILDPVSRRIIREMRRPMEDLRGYVGRRGRPVQKIQSYFRDEATQRAVLAALAEEFPELSVACSLPGNVELTHRDATKGAAMTALCAYLGIPLERAAAFGDERNDCSMLAAAGMGVAMGNAAPEAKAAARLVTDTNQEDGVARTLLRLLEEGA